MFKSFMRLKIYWQFYAFVSLGFLVMTLLQICRRVLWHEFFFGNRSAVDDFIQVKLH